MVDLLGQVALGRDTTAALKLFEMNASLYPTSANAVASLGDVWLAKKDTTKAVGYYEKALAMRPGLKRPKDMLQKLKHGP
jgi:tetratricopeptide (TPR) repeat protein